MHLLPYSRQIMQIYNMTKFVLPDFVHGIIIVIGLACICLAIQMKFSSALYVCSSNAFWLLRLQAFNYISIRLFVPCF